ncbi:hypothetical protein P3X46_020247 [Hevea brasiliensis]|uniref:EF-hand domain-containing protein n=1 Tax=Hevea brasiliensis TaxID=3981 RepID=A0ABQ9LND7_HEVBR|nr:sodium/calcium exchanger NCL2 [Hevea brasiliensis]KAJ9168755.1 hypothetical protein P3X46_020247 [Hevea brasiliensis]
MVVRLTFWAILVLLMVGNAQGRGIRRSGQVVSARVVDHLDLNSSTPSSTALNSTKHSCAHYYGFLPCASNIPGYIFQIVVLEYLLLVGDKILTKGRQQLFSILGVGIYGATVFRILAVLPTIVLVLASGLAQNKEAAQVRIENGAGSLAGSTVFYLTLQWGICVFLGRNKVTNKESSPHPQQDSSKASTPAGCLQVKQRLSKLKEYGVETDKKTSTTAGIMLLSLIPFIIVEIAGSFKSRPWSHIVTLTVSVAALVSYFFFQSRHQWIQQRSLEYSRDQLLLAGFLDHLQKYAKRTLVNDEGNVDASCIKRTFQKIDKDNDDHISKAELKEFLANMKSEYLELHDESAINELMKHFDQDSNHKITEDEFHSGCEKFVCHAKKMVADKIDCSKQYLPRIHQMVQPWIDRNKRKLLEIEEQLSKILNTAQNEQLACLLNNGKPDEDKIRSLFVEFDQNGDKKLTVQELKELIASKFKSVKLEPDDLVAKMMKAFDMDEDHVLHEEEFLDGFKKRLVDGTSSQFFNECPQKEQSSIRKMPKRSLMKALFGVGLGIAVVSSLGLPLINNTQLLSERLGIPSFFISFVVLPFAVNFKTAMANIYPASQKKEGASSIMFSEIYGAVFMNNILGLLTLLALMWARGLSWDFSAEVLVLVVVSAIIGLMGYRRNKYPFWTCFLAFSLYPLSLVLFYVIHFLVGWK